MLHELPFRGRELLRSVIKRFAELFNFRKVVVNGYCFTLYFIEAFCKICNRCY